MRNIGKIVVMASLLLTTVGCQKNLKFEKSIETGKVAIVDGDYEKAKGFFNMAIEADGKSEEADALYKQTVKLIEATELKDEEKFEEAKSKLEEIGSIESKSTVVKEEVSNLEKEIEKGINVVNSENDKKQNTNDTTSTTVPEKESKNDVVNQTAFKKQSYLDKLNQLEIQTNKVHEDYGSGASSTAEYVTGTENVYNKYDKLINEIYSDLKKHLSSSQMSELKSIQLDWIAEKESRKEAILKNEPGAHANWVAISLNDAMTEMTKERCYELLNYFN